MRILSYYLTASLAACFGAAIMALLKVGATGDEMPKCRTCQFFPTPDGIAHECGYWQKLTNERGYCSNWRDKGG